VLGTVNGDENTPKHNSSFQPLLLAGMGGLPLAAMPRRRPSGELLLERDVRLQGRNPMSQRFISNVALAIAGAVVVVSSQAFSASVTGWLMFGISLGVLAVLAVVQRDRARGGIQRLLDAAIGVLALWSAVASVCPVCGTSREDRHADECPWKR
jgi:hypothetical protein